MFEVHCQSPIDDNWEARSEQIREVAEIEHKFKGTGSGVMEHMWVLATFDQAKALVDALNTIPEVHAVLREITTYGNGNKKKRFRR